MVLADRIARLLGACSPIAMWRNVTSENARTQESRTGPTCKFSMPSPTFPSPSSIGWTTRSIAKPSARLATVIPSCEADR